MANLRSIKKDIDYLTNAVVYDCYVSLMFHDDKHDEILDLMQEAVDNRNNLFEMVNNPADSKNRSLVRKHYSFIRSQMYEKADEIFEKLSKIGE